MELTLGEALNIAKVLPGLLEKEIPVVAALQLSRAVDQINDELRSFDKVRTKLVEKYGKRDEDGNLVHKDQQYEIADIPSFNEEYEKLTGQKIEIQYEQIPIEDLGDIKIATNAMLGLGILFKQ